MRKGQSVLWTWIPISLALVFTILIALLTGFYSVTGDVGWASFGGGGLALAGCATVVSCPVSLIVAGAGMAGIGAASILTGSGDNVELQLSDAADARATGVLPHLIMESTSSNGEPVGERVKECVYRYSVPGDSCSYTEFESDVGGVIRERAFEAYVKFEGENVLTASSGELSADRQASYSLLMPLKGGERARLVLHVEGAPAGVWWEE